jgi:flagellar FliL protein
MAKEQEAVAKGGKGKLIIVMVVLTLVLVGGAIAGTLFLTGAFSPAAQATSADGMPAPVATPPPPPAFYVSLDPPLVLNFSHQGEIRFAQVSISAMTRSEATVEAVETHLPRIRNALIMLFSSKAFDSLGTLEGKEGVRQEALLAVREILDQEARLPEVEALYFTNFVMQ